MSMYLSLKPQFQTNLNKGGVSDNTIIDLEDENVICAIQFLQVGNGNIAKFVNDSDYARLQTEVEGLLQVRCGQGGSMLASDATALSTMAYLMPELAKREREKLLNTFTATPSHFSEQFPPDLTSSEQKREYSIGRMIHAFNVYRPGVLRPTSRPSNQIMDALLQFGLSKAGLKDNFFALTSFMPDFGKLAMKAGVTEESVGGADSKLAIKKEGGEVEPKSIGQIGQVWNDFLSYAEAVWRVQMPDGTFYGKEAGFTTLRECYSELASQRRNVAAVCSALNNGWRRLCDELITSNDDFVAVCRSIKKSDVWVESTNKRANEPNEANQELKKLKAELAAVKARQQYRPSGPPYRPGGQYNESPGGADRDKEREMVKSNKPCFDFFAGKPCSRKPCPFRHDGPPPEFNPAAGKKK